MQTRERGEGRDNERSEGRGDGRGDDRGNRTRNGERGTISGINEGDIIKVKRIISMNDELFYMSSTSDSWEQLYAINSFKTNFPYKVHNGIGYLGDNWAIEYGTPFEIYVLDQALSTAICALTAFMAAMIALF